MAHARQVFISRQGFVDFMGHVELIIHHIVALEEEFGAPGRLVRIPSLLHASVRTFPAHLFSLPTREMGELGFMRGEEEEPNYLSTTRSGGGKGL